MSFFGSTQINTSGSFFTNSSHGSNTFSINSLSTSGNINYSGSTTYSESKTNYGEIIIGMPSYLLSLSSR